MSATLGDLEQLVLLALLQLGDLAYGVPIRRMLGDRSGRDVALATVYSTLDRLEEKGYVLTRMGEPTAERGGKRKRYYRPSAAGLRALRQSLGSIRALTAGLDREWQA
jgi:DNA-binding PadR family transcriptional regulator